MAAATNMPSSVPSPPTPGQPFTLLSYPVSSLLLFTRQTVFTQRGLAVCLQRIRHISWPLTTPNSAQYDSKRPSGEVHVGRCAPVAPLRLGQEKKVTHSQRLTAIRKELKRHAHKDLFNLFNNLFFFFSHHPLKTNKLARKGLLSNKGSRSSRFLKSISFTNRMDLNENRLW